jgi:hypothetical protein
MKIELKNGKSASLDAIAALEKNLGRPLSSSVKLFLQTNDGAETEPNRFKIDGKNEGGINEFIPASQIWKERTYIENIPKLAYPIAWAACGDAVLIDEGAGGAVFYWEHEYEDRITKLADDFETFLNQLEPFDISKITLKPGQVKRVWTHPDFDKLVKKYEK